MIPDAISIESMYDDLYRRKPTYGDMNHSQTITPMILALRFDEVLDIGCGSGHFLQSMVEKGKQAFGIDISQEAVNKAILTCNSGNIRKGTIEKIPFDRTFGLVTSFDVLEHVPEDSVSQAISELHRVADDDVVVSVAFNKDKIMGYNLHLTVQNEEWWSNKFSEKFGVVNVMEKAPNKAFFHLKKTES